MQLIHTIEITPFSFAGDKYEMPQVGGSKEFPEEWYQYWKNCLAEKNLGRLEPIQKASHLVNIETINDAELEEILKHKFSDMESIIEEVSRMDGGIALWENNQLYIEPQCCGDIGDLSRWEEIVQSAENQWHQIWIGHPFIYYRRNNGHIDFSDYVEPGKEGKEYEVLVTVSQSDLQMELIKMRKLNNDFEQRIRKTLDKMGVADSVAISKILTGND